MSLKKNRVGIIFILTITLLLSLSNETGIISNHAVSVSDSEQFLPKTSDINTQDYIFDGNFTWGYTDDDIANTITVDGFGNIYIAGNSEHPGDNYCDAFLAKYNRTLDLIWNITWNEGPNTDNYVNGIDIDAEGNLYLVGEVEGNELNTDDAIFLRKYNNSGNLKWEVIINRTENDSGSDIIIDDSGNIYIAGYVYNSSIDTNTAFFAKYNTNGIQIWNRTYRGALKGMCHGIDLDEMGNLYLTGNIYQSTWKTFVAVYNATGYFEWDIIHEGSGMLESGSKIAVSSSGDIYVIGTIHESTSHRAFIAKFNTSQEKEWIIEYDSTVDNEPGGLVLNSQNNVYVVINYDEQYAYDTYLYHLTPQGEQIFNITYTDLYDDENWADMVLDENETIYLAGYTNHYLPQWDPNDAWVIKFREDMAPTWDQAPENQIIEINTDLSYDVNASDQTLVVGYSVNNTDDFTIDSEGILTNNSALDFGTYWVEINATDPFNNNGTAVVSVSVVDQTPPTWVEEPQYKTIELGTLLSYDVNASDYTGILGYSVNDTDQFSISSSGELVSKDVLELEVYWIEINATDMHHNNCSAQISVTVIDTTSPTWVEGLENKTIDFGASFRYDVNASDLSNALVYTLNDTENFQIDSEGLITNRKDLAAGDYWIQVNATDSSDNYCTAVFSVTVNPPEDNGGDNDNDDDDDDLPPNGIPGYDLPILLGVIGLFSLYSTRKRKN